MPSMHESEHGDVRFQNKKIAASLLPQRAYSVVCGACQRTKHVTARSADGAADVLYARGWRYGRHHASRAVADVLCHNCAGDSGVLLVYEEK